MSSPTRLAAGAPAALAGTDAAAAGEPRPTELVRALLGLGLLSVVLFGPAQAGRRVFFERDILSYWLPQATSFVRTVGTEAAPPLWNPLFAFGQPMLEDPSYQVLYPPTWLNLIVGPGAFFTTFVTLHWLAAGSGAFILAVRLGCGGLGAFATAAAWSASGPLLSAASLHHHFAGLAWTPWVLIGLDRALRRGSWDGGLALGAALGIQALAGSADVCLATCALGAGYLAWWTATLGSRAALRRALPALALAAALAVGLSAAQTLPTLWLTRTAPRSGHGAATSLYWSIHPISLVDTVVDRAAARFPMTAELRSALYESRGPFLSSLYLGLPAAWLMALGLLLPDRPRLAAWALAGFAVCILIGLGRHTPLLPLLLRLPGAGLLRYPAKAMFPASLLWASLVGLGFAAWQGSWALPHRRRASLLACLAVTVGVVFLLAARWVDTAPAQLAGSVRSAGGQAGVADALAATSGRLRVAAAGSLLAGLLIAARAAWRQAPRWLTTVTLVLVVGDLVRAGMTVNDLAPPELLAHGPPLLDLLPSTTGETRIYSFAPQPGIEPVRGPAGWSASWAATLGAVEALRPPSGARWSLSGSFDGDFTGLAPHALTHLSQLLLKQRRSRLATRLLQVGSVDYVIAEGEAPFPDLVPLGEQSSVFASPLRLFRVPAPLARVYWVGRARLISAPTQALELLSDPRFDPRSEVILPAGSPAVSYDPAARGAGRILERQPDRLRLEVSATGPGYLVLVEAHRPGWQATVDGQPASVLLANALFRAVAVPAGQHLVEMAYRPRSVFAGLTISALALLAGSAAWLAARAVAKRRVAWGRSAQ